MKSRRWIEDQTLLAVTDSYHLLHLQKVPLSCKQHCWTNWQELMRCYYWSHDSRNKLTLVGSHWWAELRHSNTQFGSQVHLCNHLQSVGYRDTSETQIKQLLETQIKQLLVPYLFNVKTNLHLTSMFSLTFCAFWKVTITVCKGEQAWNVCNVVRACPVCWCTWGKKLKNSLVWHFMLPIGTFPCILFTSTTFMYSSSAILPSKNI